MSIIAKKKIYKIQLYAVITRNKSIQYKNFPYFLYIYIYITSYLCIDQQMLQGLA